MPSYGQFCPVAKAMEVLDERWTLLVVRELLSGSSHFNELRRGVPKMSPALLSKRLRSLERAGVIQRTEADGRTSYALTESGRELGDVVDALAVWGVRWIGDLGDEDLDPHLLLWDMRRKVPVEAWPRRRTVLAIEFDDSGVKAKRWWLVVADGDVDVCDYDPGFDVAATLSTSLRTLTRLWRGDLAWPDALGAGLAQVTGPEPVRRQVPEWVGQSTFAAVPRPA
ncbi:MAG TPA: helix-turn-helix domain-containing protein [Aldersonia sp.]